MRLYCTLNHQEDIEHKTVFQLFVFMVSYYAVVGKVHACERELRNMYCSIKDGQLSDTAAVMHLPQIRNLQVSQENLKTKFSDLWYTRLPGTFLIS